MQLGWLGALFSWSLPLSGQLGPLLCPGTQCGTAPPPTRAPLLIGLPPCYPAALLPRNRAGWQTVQLRFADFKPVFRARTQLGMPPINAANICSLQLMLSKFEADGALNPTFKEGPFQLPVQQISGGWAGGRLGGLAGWLGCCFFCLCASVATSLVSVATVRLYTGTAAWPLPLRSLHLPCSLHGAAAYAALCAGGQRGGDATRPPRHRR